MKRKIKRYQEPRKGIQYITHTDTRKELNPFTFFDAGTMQRNDEGLFIGMHPHSGIGILTYFEGGNLQHDDSGNNENIIKSGGVQWIRAGGGVWHQENYLRPDRHLKNWPLTIHQLWMQLPPELEESEVEYQNFQPEQIPIVDNVKIIVGHYKGLTSPVKTPYEMTYLDVELKSGQTFDFATPDNQTRGFIFPREGNLILHGQEITLNRISILEENTGICQIEAVTDAKFVFLTSAPQNYDVIAQRGSIHTNTMALQRSLRRIEELRMKRNYV